MSRKISMLWLIPTLLFGLDLGFRLADRQNSGIRAQVPIPANTPTQPNPNNSATVRGSEDHIHKELLSAYQSFEPVNNVFQKVARTLSPSVVHIIAIKKAPPGARVEELEESGSGVIIQTSYPGQFILTNNHVVQQSEPRAIQIHLADGRVISPEKVWSDEKADIAVLKLAHSAPQLAPAKLGNSDEIQVGTWVLALGSPFGLMHSVSQGIISARGRHEAELFQDGVENQDFLQTDAAINPGNSGGPLVNLKGEVIGINTAIASQGGGSEGVGFSIPINLARWIMDQLLTHGRVNRGAMGVDLDDVLPPVAAELGLDRPKGALVKDVHPDSPAMKAGLLSRDVIIGFNSNAVNDLNHLVNLVSMAPIGKPAEVVVWRNKQEFKLDVMVGSRDRVLARSAVNPTPGRPEQPNRQPNFPRMSVPTVDGPWGLKVSTLSSTQITEWGLEKGTQGAVILSIQDSSPLANELEPGDIISAINGRHYATAQGLMEALRIAVEETPDKLNGNPAGPNLEIEVIRARPGQPIQVFVLRVNS